MNKKIVWFDFRKINFGNIGGICHKGERLGAGGMARTFIESILKSKLHREGRNLGS